MDAIGGNRMCKLKGPMDKAEHYDVEMKGWMQMGGHYDAPILHLNMGIPNSCNFCRFYRLRIVFFLACILFSN